MLPLPCLLLSCSHFSAYLSAYVCILCYALPLFCHCCSLPSFLPVDVMCSTLCLFLLCVVVLSSWYVVLLCYCFSPVVVLVVCCGSYCVLLFRSVRRVVLQYACFLCYFVRFCSVFLLSSPSLYPMVHRVICLLSVCCICLLSTVFFRSVRCFSAISLPAIGLLVLIASTDAYVFSTCRLS